MAVVFVGSRQSTVNTTFFCLWVAQQEIDNRMIGDGKRGPITERIQKRFFEVVSGLDELHPEWLKFV